MKLRVQLFILLLSVTLSALGASPLKVLAIGNSFSEDATEEYLSQMAMVSGHDLLICNLYFPGCSVEQHREHLTNNMPVYSYRKISIGGHVERHEHCTLATALMDEDWDIITFQQGSAYSGVWKAYRRLPELIKRVRQIVGPHPVFYWHQTWAYAPNSTHEAFKTYGKDQMKMYTSIVECTKKVLAANPQLRALIPVGTAIQNARTSILGDDLTRDGFHLDKKVGRYIAACTWFEVLFKQPFTLSTFLPAGMTVEEGRICREAVEEAVLHPYQITPITVDQPETVDEAVPVP